MAVDVSKIPNNNKFDPVREAILKLQQDVRDGVAGVATVNSSDGNITITNSGTITVGTVGETITIGIDDSTYLTSADLSDYLSLSETGLQTIAGDITISGDLTVSGTTTYINTNHLNIGDNIITLNADLPSGTAPTENAGIEINRGSSPTVDFLWNETSNEWDLQSVSGARIYNYSTGSTTLTIEAGSTAGDAVIALTPNVTGTGGVIKTTNERPIVFQPNSTSKVVIASDGNMNVYEKLAVGKTTAASTYPLEVDGAVLAQNFKAQMESGGTTYTGTLDQYFGSLQIRTDSGGTISLGGSGTGTVQNNVFIKDGDLDVNGDVTADNFIGDGSQLTNLPGGSDTLQDVTDNGATTTNGITAASFTGDGSGLTSVDADTLDSYQLSGTSSVSDKIFNNKGNVHSTYTNFNTVMNAGANYLQGGTNGPTGTAGHQWYGFMLGLGSDYGTSTGTTGDYASQLYWGRQGESSNNPYLWARDMESGTWGSWRKMSAGNADNADTLNGVAGSSFLRSDADDTATGKITINNNSNSINDPTLTITSSQGGGSFGRLMFSGTSTVAGVINRSVAGSDLYFDEDATTGKYIFRSSGDATFNGALGIGTTSPSEKLVVIGDIGVGVGGYNGGVYANNTSSDVDKNWGFEVQKTSGVDDYNVRLKFYNTAGTARKLGFYAAQNNDWILYADGNTNSIPNIIIPNSNLGIGISSPSSKLHIYTSANSDMALRVQNSPTNLFVGVDNTTGSRFIGSSGSAAYIGTTTSSPIEFATANTVRMHIDSSGIVEIKQSAKFGTNINATQYVIVSENQIYRNSGDLYINYSTSGSNNVIIGNASTNVGIGTTSPSTKLHIYNGSGDANFTLQSGSQTMLIDQNSIRTTTNSQIAIFTNNNVANGVYINSSGKVGMGNSSPSYKLDIGSGQENFIRIHNAASGDVASGLIISRGSSGLGLQLYDNPADNTTTFRTGGHVNFFYAGSSYNLFLDGGNGRVGIGTSSPSARLDVNGIIKANGNQVNPQEYGVSMVGNFGQWQNHSTYTDLNTVPSYWGWNFVQGNGNAPNSNSAQWYRGRFSLGDQYGLGTDTGDYWMEIAVPRYNYAGGDAGQMFVRACESGVEGSWYQVGRKIIGDFTATGDVVAYSDARVKENVVTIDNALDKIKAMRGVYYNRTDKEDDKSKKVGVIAQEIEKVLPEVVTEDNDGMKGVAYGNIVGVLIEAIKEQQKQIDELKSRLDGSTK